MDRLLTFRAAEAHDCKLYFDWANDELVRSQSLNGNQISWEEHQKWFNNKLQDPNTTMYLFFSGDQPAGQVRFEKKKGRYLVGISVADKFRGQGLGQQILRRATIHFTEKCGEAAIAQIKPSNTGSVIIFKKAGYKKTLDTPDLLEFHFSAQ